MSSHTRGIVGHDLDVATETPELVMDIHLSDR